jgi:acetoacetyl-CoA synthetase
MQQISPVWTPSQEKINHSEMKQFIQIINKSENLKISNSKELHQWSVQNLEKFWSHVWDTLDVKGFKGSKYLNRKEIWNSEFFPEASLNVGENYIFHYKDSDEIAMFFVREDGYKESITGRDLYKQVSKICNLMIKEGISPGDRVAAYMPNCIETVIIMIATVSLGAVFSSTSPDFGSIGVVDRFGQIEPKLLFTIDHYLYNGKSFSQESKIREILPNLPTLKKTILIHYLDTKEKLNIENTLYWREWVSKENAETFVWEHFPFDQPSFILFSSGTTGKPKCFVHRGAGFVLKHLVEHRLHSNLKKGDRVFYYTTCGWMMWNWLVGALFYGGVPILFDGNPFYPNSEALIKLIDEYQIKFFGVSAKYIDSLMKSGVHWKDKFPLKSLGTVASTGSPLSPEGYQYIYDHFKSDVHLAGISGGTDLCGCFLGGDPTQPVYPGQMQTAVLGMDVEVWDESGNLASTNEKGELVCKSPFPSTPIGFWNDPENQIYQKSYFQKFPKIWTHGDFVSRTDQGGWVIHGRSDATLNPGGVRIGTAEIYRIVEGFPSIAESLAIGQNWKDDVRVILFVKMASGELNQTLIDQIKSELKLKASPRHVPSKIIAVTDLPRTKSNKLVELAVGDIIHNRTIRNKESIANPESLELFKNLPDLQVD